MKNSEQPAFPEQDRNEAGDVWTVSGLTKREYTAIKAMQGLLANGHVPDLSEFDASQIAHDAVSYADALLAELDKTQTP